MVSDILRPGNKVEIKAVQKIERQGSTGEVAHVSIQAGYRKSMKMGILTFPCRSRKVSMCCYI